MNGRLQAERLCASLGGVQVLHDVTLALTPGWTAIVGPNGAGKSTLLRCLAGLVPAVAGRVLLQGKALKDWPARERARQIAWLGQQVESTGELTVREVVRLGRLPATGLFARLSAHDDALVERAMIAAECDAWPQRRLTELSGGERQRVLLACALAVDAPLLLLDEPTTHLDPPHQVSLVRLFKRLAQQSTVVTVMHDIPLALQADQLVVMQSGRVVAQGALDDPHLRAALMRVFDHAILIERVGERWMAWPDLG